MRGLVLIVSLGVASTLSWGQTTALTFDDIVQRSLADPVLLARSAAIARWQRELAATREGPTLEAELGPRRMGDGAVKTEAMARIDVPLLSGGRVRADADSRLRGAGPDVLVADAVESRLRLRTAYLDAWLAQERLKVLDAQARAIEQLVASVRKRVEGGAEAPFEAALVVGEMQRSHSESDGARSVLGEAWSALRALADLPAEPQTLASPGMPELNVPADVESKFEAGVLRRAVAHRGSLESAFLGLEQAQRRSRWSATATLGREADDLIATVGASYRFPSRGEGPALDRELAAAGVLINRGAEAEAARLATRFETAIERAGRFGPVTPPDAFDDALRAVALRVELGKERPSLALPIRRQLLDAQATALQRVRDAHLLQAEITALIAGEAP
jgi:hypothetical protein